MYVAVAVGGECKETTVESTAVHPFASVTVTRYVPAMAGNTKVSFCEVENPDGPDHEYKLPSVPDSSIRTVSPGHTGPVLVGEAAGRL